ncbi:MAG: glycosyltransferase family 39 protein [Alphaproteobacteria bacterium]|nr:glycosyltransferase family 39 protein [Alphaproteobacteria bacterium]MCB9931348.1 glycosyltransferase family 39 protein [Alphaproteobacteria bacterium]
MQVPPLDRDEPRFAQASKQMLETGDFVQIAFQDEPRLKKPIGIYWLQAASAGLLAPNEPTALWAYRLPSLIGVVLSVLLTAGIGRTLFKGPVGAIGAALFSLAILPGVEAHLAKTDAVLLACILAAQWGLAKAWMADHPATARGPVTTGPWTAAAFWLAIGAGVLVKGPVVVMIAGLTALTLALWHWRFAWLKALRPLWGLPLALAVIVPWFVAIHFATHGAFWDEAVGRDFLAKIDAGQERHGGPPGLYLLLVWVTFWPAAALLGFAGLGAWRGRMAPAVRFCLAWIVPSWLVFEAVATKLPHYVLPLYPALALLAGYMLVRAGQKPKRRWVAELVRAPVWIAVAVAAGLGIAMFAGPPFIGGDFNLASIAAAAGFGILAYALYRFARRAYAAPFPLGVVVLAAGLAYWSSYSQVIPGLSQLWVSSRLAAAVADHTPAACGKPARLVSVGYGEPSLVFLAGTDTALVRTEEALPLLIANPDCTLVAVEERRWPAFQEQTQAVALETLATIDGLNYSKGKRVSIRLLRLAP